MAGAPSPYFLRPRKQGMTVMANRDPASPADRRKNPARKKTDRRNPVAEEAESSPKAIASQADENLKAL